MRPGLRGLGVGGTPAASPSVWRSLFCFQTLSHRLPASLGDGEKPYPGVIPFPHMLFPT